MAALARQALLSRARRFGAEVLDALLPPACVSCERALDQDEEGPACGRCWARVALLPAPRCERCGHPSDGRGHECRWCPLLQPFVRAARSVCWVPGGTAGAMVHALKYDGWSAMASPMARRMARLAWPADVIEERTAVVPVPLSKSRERERGYNQSALLARHLAASWQIPAWEDCLTRVRSTRTQTRLTPDQRRSNVFGAFRAVRDSRARIAGAHIMLVDDVVTTAATLNECAAALMDGGARIISYVTFGRAPAAGDR